MSAFEYDESELPEVKFFEDSLPIGDSIQAGDWSFYIVDEGDVSETRDSVLSWIAFYEWRVANEK